MRKNLTISMPNEYTIYIKVLQQKFNINISALLRNTIKSEYDRMVGEHEK